MGWETQDFDSESRVQGHTAVWSWDPVLGSPLPSFLLRAPSRGMGCTKCAVFVVHTV